MVLVLLGEIYPVRGAINRPAALPARPPKVRPTGTV